MDKEEAREFCESICVCIEFKYDRPLAADVPQAERIAWGVFSFCGIVESDGLLALIEQPEEDKAIMYEAVTAVGGTEHVDNVQAAEKALADSGVDPNEEYERAGEIIEKYQNKFFADVDHIYVLLATYIEEHIEDYADIFKTFNDCQENGLDFLDPRVWKEGNLEKAKKRKLKKRILLFIINIIAGLSIVAAIYWMKTPAKEISASDNMMRHASGAVDIADKDYNIKLDYSPKSIMEVEKILGKLHEVDTGQDKIKKAKTMALFFGAYIGECIRRSTPGAKWEKDHSVFGKKTYPLTWRSGTSFPLAWCYRRIMNGPKDNVWHKYLALQDKELFDALIYPKATLPTEINISLEQNNGTK